jgi:hypothetical protein
MTKTVPAAGPVVLYLFRLCQADSVRSAKAVNAGASPVFRADKLRAKPCPARPKTESPLAWFCAVKALQTGQLAVDAAGKYGYRRT